MNPRDKLFYDGLTRGAIGLFNKNKTVADILMAAPSFILGVGAIGVRIIMRKRQGYLEFWDIVKLILHMALIAFFILWAPNKFLGINLLWVEHIFSPASYLSVVVFATFYHFFIDFRYPRIGLETKKEYRGKSLLGKSGLDEIRDMKVRLIDPLIVALIGLSLFLEETTINTGIILVISAGCLSFEEFEYNYHIDYLRRTWEGNEEFAKFIAQMKENEQSKRINNDDHFNPEITD